MLIPRINARYIGMLRACVHMNSMIYIEVYMIMHFGAFEFRFFSSENGIFRLNEFPRFIAGICASCIMYTCRHIETRIPNPNFI